MIIMCKINITDDSSGLWRVPRPQPSHPWRGDWQRQCSITVMMMIINMTMMIRTLMTLTIQGVGPLRWRQQWNDFSEYPGQGHHLIIWSPSQSYSPPMIWKWIRDTSTWMPWTRTCQPWGSWKPSSCTGGCTFSLHIIFPTNPPSLKMWCFGCNLGLGKKIWQAFVFTGITSGATSRELGRPDWRRRVEQKSIKILFSKE